MVTPGEISWLVTRPASAVLSDIESAMPQSLRQPNRDALRAFLCQYFNSGNRDCVHKIEKSIAPIGADGRRKHFKMRWLIPGAGKRGGLRLAIAVDCETRRVWLAGAWLRKDDPSDGDFDEAFGTIES